MIYRAWHRLWPCELCRCWDVHYRPPQAAFSRTHARDHCAKWCQQAYRLAFKYEAERGSCPQCVLAAIKETLDVGDEATIKSADALAGGTALSTKGTCGALVGGLLAIGSIVGREYDDFKQGKRKRRVFYFANKLYEKFIELIREYGLKVETGIFAARMCVEIQNDGPVTLILKSAPHR